MRVTSGRVVVHVVVVVLVLSVGLPALDMAGGPGMAVEATAQAVGDDTVILTQVQVPQPAYIAIHAPTEDGLGPVLGWVAVGGGTHENVAVPVGGPRWRRVDGAVDLVAVVHKDDGDGTFEYPDSDEVYQPSRPTVARFTVTKRRQGSARVVGTHQLTTGTVTLSRVDLPAAGFVVLYAGGNGSRGRVVGARRLGAGHHANVTVAVDPAYYNRSENPVYLVAAVVLGEDPLTGELVTVGGDPVAVRFPATKRAPTATGDANGSTSPGRTATPATAGS